MLSWSSKRKLLYILSFAFLVFLLVVIPTLFLIKKQPTCSDNKQNQGERGIDCEGPCKLVCLSSVINPIVEWQRFFLAGSGNYNAVSFIENTNANLWSPKADYIFRLYDENGILVTEREGSTRIPSGKNFPIYESNVKTGGRTPSTITFEFKQFAPWQRDEGNVKELRITKKSLSNDNNKTRLDGTIKNENVFLVNDVEVIAIIYDRLGNAIDAAKTFVSEIEDNHSVNVVFTWPKVIKSEDVSRVDIIAFFKQS